MRRMATRRTRPTINEAEDGDNEAEDDNDGDKEAAADKNDKEAPQALAAAEKDIANDPDSDSGSEGYDTDGADCPALPTLSTIKCNANLAAALGGVVNLRKTDFEKTRRLAFE